MSSPEASECPTFPLLDYAGHELQVGDTVRTRSDNQCWTITRIDTDRHQVVAEKDGKTSEFSGTSLCHVRFPESKAKPFKTSGTSSTGMSWLISITLCVILWSIGFAALNGLAVFGAFILTLGIGIAAQIKWSESEAGKAQAVREEQRIIRKTEKTAKSALNIHVSATTITVPGQGSIRSIGARASVESSGSLVKRATVTRLAAGALIAGPVGALAMGIGAKKKFDDRRIYVYFENAQGAQLVADADKKHETEIRQWVGRFNSSTGPSANELTL